MFQGNACDAMKNPSFTLTLTPRKRPGRFMLNGGVITYPIAFHQETDMEFNVLLHSLNQMLTSGESSIRDLHITLLREIGTRLWRLLIPKTGPFKSRSAFADDIR